MSEPVLLTEQSDGVPTFTLNRPAAMNALSRELRRAIVEAFRGLPDDVGVVILTGAGRAFTAGLDLKEFGDKPPRGPTPGTPSPRRPDPDDGAL